MPKRIEREASVRQVKVEGRFWKRYQDLVCGTVIPYQERIMKDEIEGAPKSGAIRNFRIAAKEEKGEFFGQVYQDSDLAKWLEAVGYALGIRKDPELEKRADEIIGLIRKAQEPDGYLDTYFQLKEPDKRWVDLLECHELYCAGHMIEAAVALYEEAGKGELLETACRLADHICSRFGKDKVRGIPGHEEIELALFRLYQVTGEERYLEEAKYFIDERGTEPNYFAEERKRRDWELWLDPEDRKYTQNHLPVREQETGEGHCVRAMYLYTAMAAIAGETKEEALYEACRKIWKNVVEKRMYITGGIGSTARGEAFTKDYDLPNDTVYAETCASIGLVFFARKMLEIRTEGQYGDVMERALYNGILSGMQQDGTHFFYVNPLEVVPGISGKALGYEHVLPTRPAWYACACCPPNVARLITSLGKYAWGQSEDTIFSHLYIGSVYETEKMTVRLETDYPWDGKASYRILKTEGREYTIACRIPGWCKKWTLALNQKPVERENIRKEEGYLYITRKWVEGDCLELIMEMKPVRIYANPAVRADAGCVALMRGPVLYCLEEADNGKALSALRLSREQKIEDIWEKDSLGEYIRLKAEGIRLISGTDLYMDVPPAQERQTLYFIPYYLWSNRGEGEMRVWVHEIE